MDFNINETPNFLLRFPDDKSDSGVSSLRSFSGDERSGSRSSALSLSDEPNLSTTGLINYSSISSSSSSNINNNNYYSPQVSNSRRSPFYVVPAGIHSAEPVRVWRDPGLLLQEEPEVRHVQSVQHQTLLMSSHQQNSSTGQQPSTSAPTNLSAALYPLPSSSIPPPSMGPHPLTQHPGIPNVASHPHLATSHFHPSYNNDINNWKLQRFGTVPTHLLGGQQPTHISSSSSSSTEEIERERHTERMIRHQHQEQQQQQQQQQQHREKEKMERERERQHEREKLEKQEKEERERQEQAQALHNHFEKSLRAAQQKREQQQWNLGNRPPQSRTSSLSEDDRKNNELHQRERERHMAAVRASEANHRAYYGTQMPNKSNISSSKSEYPPPAHSRHSSSGNKLNTAEKLSNIHQSMIPKSELAMYGYQVHTSPNAFYEPKKSDIYKSTSSSSSSSGLVVTKTNQIGLENSRINNSDISNHQSSPSSMLLNEGGKSSVIVKHDAKNSSHQHVEPRVSIALSPSPKLRNELMGHYIAAAAAASNAGSGAISQKQQQQQQNMYDYRSPTQSPHHLNPHASSAISPHHVVMDQSKSAVSQQQQHHRTSLSQNQQLSQNPHQQHQRQSPHGGGGGNHQIHNHSHNQQHHSPELRYRQEIPANIERGQQPMMYQSSVKASYPYLPTSSNVAFTMASTQQNSAAGSKPKVSSPAPHHIYGKPTPVSIVPVSRSLESSQQQQNLSVVHKPLGSSISPSPYQQISQYHPPMTASPALTTCPPPAHSSRTTSALNYERLSYGNGGVGGGPIIPPASLSVKVLNHHQPSGGIISPPTGASAPLNNNTAPSRSHFNYNVSPGPSLHSQQQQQFQTQPLDLGISSNKFCDNGQPTSPKRKGTSLIGSPVCLEVKKRRIDTPPGLIPPNNSLLQQNFTKNFPNNVPNNNNMSMMVNQHHQPQLSRVSEPSPLIASAATTITTLVNTAAYRSPVTTTPNSFGDRNKSPNSLTENLPDLSVTAVTIDVTTRPASTDSSHSVPLIKPGTPLGVPPPPPPSSISPSSNNVRNSTTPTNTAIIGFHIPPTNNDVVVNNGTTTALLINNDGTSSSTPPVAEETCPLRGGGGTTVNTTPSVDSEKSNSPGPPQKSSSSGNYPVRHLKKAWLQRHTGEDLEDTTGLVGTGSCVSLPLNIANTTSSTTATIPPPPPPAALAAATVKNENPVNSIHSVGSMAVNSINKSSKHFPTKSSVGRKPKDSASQNNVNNGHPIASVNELGGKNAVDDSSSSDQERGGRKSPPKRKPPKVKRKKGGAAANSAAAALAAKKAAAAEEKKRKGENKLQQQATTPHISDSGSESDKESDSTKDSDSGASTIATTTLGTGNGNNGGNNGGGGGGSKKPAKEPRKRGRRPKGSKNDKGEEPRVKKPKEEPPRDPFRKPPVGQLKKTGETFLQDGPCFEVAPKLAKCRECRWTPHQRSRNMPNIFCRFYAFRRLRYTKNGQLAIAGFSDPHKDAMDDDVKLWIPNTDMPPTDLDLDTSRFILTQVGDHFCDLLVQEKEAHDEHLSDDKIVAWKRVVQGVREMCDVCETTLFNYHWACGKCGFVVCLDCYKSRKKGAIKSTSETTGKDRDEFMWLLCTNRSSHEQEKLMLTQIIADDCLLKLGKMVHEMRELWAIEQFCACPSSKESKVNNVECKEVVKSIMAENKLNGVKKEIKEEPAASSKPPTTNGIKDEKPQQQQQSSLNWLADVALSKSEETVKKEPKETPKEEGAAGGGSSSEEEGNFSTLRELLIRPSHKTNGSSSRAASPVVMNKTSSEKKKVIKSSTSAAESSSDNDALSTFSAESTTPNNNKVLMEKDEQPEEKIELKHYIRRYNWLHKGRQQLPIRIMTLTESKILYPNVAHSWLCDGKLLRLSDPICKDNIKIFQDQWKRGQPVIVSDICKSINKELWNPEAFSRDFGDEKNDLINCMTGNLVPNQPMRKFWEGFEEPAKRLKDDRGQPMFLKLKDWPPAEDFAEMLPARFQDLMQALPLQEYTRRSGKLNLASRLPDCFVRPDLGPKMYNAYGSAMYPNKGTTNLHLDVSDAVNVMVYVGVPNDGAGAGAVDDSSDEHMKEAFRAIDEAGCDILTRRRVRDKGELPGALWHIYNARDADKIRDLLNKVTVERGGRLEPHNDPIHDQSGYLDGALRERLYKEYGVEGYAVVQCLGDAVFIPAGAPHQVRNLHNCIKVAEDFVSPENVAHCFHLTQEFRGLSDVHTNHEDKLQIKNIIYHAVKDALSTLGAIVNQRLLLGKKTAAAAGDVVEINNATEKADCSSSYSADNNGGDSV